MKAIKIGEQVWTKRNLKVDHYRNGDIIPEVQNTIDWANLTNGAWCYYENKKLKKHGKLYNWYAVNDPRGLAPVGWHIPTKEEFETLMSTVKNDGNSLKAKIVGKDNAIGKNATGFSALLDGYRAYNGRFDGIIRYTSYWSFTEYSETHAYDLNLYYHSNYPYVVNVKKGYGFNVRLIKD